MKVEWAIGARWVFGFPAKTYPLDPSVFNVAIEHGHLWLIYLLKVVMFHICVSLPEIGMAIVFHP
jgi:hypothetical protein